MVIKKVGIVGGGHMGADLFGLFSDQEFEVILWVRRPEVVATLQEELLGALRRKASRGGDRGAAAAAKLARVKITSDLADLADVDFISESIVEDVATKRVMFEQLNAVVKPEAIFSTNSSFTTPSELAPASGRPDRFIGLHFFFPSRFVPFIEVIPGSLASPETTAATVELVRGLGRRPVMIKKEVPGFLVNRLVAPVTIEGLHMMGEGHFTASQVDTICRRMFTRGPIETSEQIGYDVMLEGELRFPHLKRPGDYMAPILPILVKAGRLGQKAGMGVYHYVDGKQVDDPNLPRALGPGGDPGPYSEQDVLDRVWLCVVIDCYRNLDLGSREDIEQLTGELLGIPEGAFAWVQRMGLDNVKAKIEDMGRRFGPRFTPPPAMTF